ncbi:OmpA family protein [Salinicola sp. LHM]|uniref:OmpA family protein n=1 Tax=Salinicola sp. LHM TaxID=3065298 RepID=UPI002ACEAE6C|nr:OmpA family protein [Salinicola sp. LHM]WQH33502.1 OmpA family protein [Salinicola sp. LHM]
MKILRSSAMLRAALGAAGIASLAITAGCASPPNNDRTDIHEAGDGFPALDKNWYDGGRFVEPENILRLAEGQTKDQVRQLIGNPHFSEGFFGVREWNYVFNLYTGESGGDYITCQYQVVFNEDMALKDTRWRDEQCPALLMPVEKKQDETLVLSGDVLFDFDSDRLSLEGRHALERVAQSTLSEFKAPRMLVAGHTDRFGDAAYNQELSRSRADTVADYLSTQGISRGDIRTTGRGEADPVVTCQGSVATQSVTECLRPNRRVEITISEAVDG